MVQRHPAIERLISLLGRLPGVGPKSAERFAYHLLRIERDEADQLAAAITAVRDSVRACSACFQLDAQDPCSVCADPARDRTTILVLEDPREVSRFEDAGYRGLYHVVQGANVFVMLNAQFFVLAPADSKRQMLDRIRLLLTARAFTWKIVVISSSFYCHPLEAECGANSFELAPLISLFLSCRVSLVLSSQRDVYRRYAPMDDLFTVLDQPRSGRSVEQLSAGSGLRQVSYGSSGNKHRTASNLSAPLQPHIRHSDSSVGESFLRLTIKTYYLSLELVDAADLTVKDFIELSVPSSDQQSSPAYLFYALLVSPSILVLLAMLYEARHRKPSSDASDIMRITNRYWDEVDLTLAEDNSK